MYISSITRALSVDTKVFLAYCSVSHITIRCIRLLTYVVWRFIRAWLVGLRHCLSSPLLFYLAGNMQYSTHSRNCLPAKRNKFTWCYIMLLVFILIDLPFPPVFSFWRELSILSALFNSYTYFRVWIVVTLTVLLRSYEQYYVRIRRFFCSSLTAIGLRSIFILLADCIT
jgi:formate hydrogenlyase subunit 3/multisubunit Na+/H+ antiporter MnhD subunit